MNPPTGSVTTDAVQEEEGARADLYALLSRLWIGPPDAALLRTLQGATGGGNGGQEVGDLVLAWRGLVDAIRATTVERAADEYDALFQGVGKPDVFLYGSYYVAGYLNERPLVVLRGDLAALGLARDETRAETEDHVAYVFEVMRWLIVGDDVAVCNLEQQRRFFRTHLQPWVVRMCDAVDAHPRADTWRAVAALTRAFVAVETQAFDMLES